jgi:uncharacterized membrane protein YoaK (UPF0700 family)
MIVRKTEEAGPVTAAVTTTDMNLLDKARRHSVPSTLLLLTATTGLVDAVSYLGLGHVFTANMTGNVVFLAFALAGASGLSVSASLLALVSFLAGALLGGRLGSLLEPSSRRRWLVLTASGEALLLAGAMVCALGLSLDASFGRRSPVIVLTALAMGLRNATVRRLGAADLTTTVLTLTLTGLAADSSFAGGRNPRATRRVGSVVAMFAGALLGAALVLHQGLALPLAIAFLAASIAAAVYTVVPEATKPPATAGRP